MESSLGKNPQSEKNNLNQKSNLISTSKELTSIEKLLIKVIRRKKILIITLIAFSIFGFIRTYKEKVFNSLYEGSFAILIKDPINQTNRNFNPEGIGSIFDANSTNLNQDIPTLRKLLLSELILNDISKDFDIKYANLADRISIQEDNTTSGILQVKLLSKTPNADLKLLKELSSVFVNYAVIQNQKKLSDGLSFLSDQEPAIKEKNMQLRNRLEDFMMENNLINPIRESQEKKKEIKLVELKIAGLTTQLKRLVTLKQEILKDNLNTARYSEIIGEENSSLEIGIGISNQYETLNQKFAEAQLIYAPSSSIVKNIKSKINLLKPIVKEKQLEIVDKSIKSKNDIIKLNNKMLIKLNNEFIKLTALIKEYEILNFDLQAASENLRAINTVKEKLQFEIAQDSKPWIIIRNPSFNPVRIYPSFKKDITNFLLIGTSLGIILCLIRDKFDDVYHSPEEIRKELNYPLLGHIPNVEFFKNIRDDQSSVLEVMSQTDEDSSINSYDKFFYQEALRNIFTSIRFLNTDKPLQVLTLTSSIPKEGKSLTSILLAKTLCEMDFKILQIDADLRKPQLHTRLSLNNLTGLSNIITNEELKISEAIQPVPGFKNWSVITSGTKPPDPTRLLQSKKLEDIISSFKKSRKYDLVLIDTPPVIGLADALLVSEKSDGLILVVSTDQVPRGLPKESINKSLESGANFLGIISNATNKQTNQLLNNYGNNYGYGNYSYTYNAYLEEEDNKNPQPNKKSRFENIKDSLLSNSQRISSNIFKWLDS